MSNQYKQNNWKFVFARKKNSPSTALLSFLDIYCKFIELCIYIAVNKSIFLRNSKLLQKPIWSELPRILWQFHRILFQGKYFLIVEYFQSSVQWLYIEVVSFCHELFTLKYNLHKLKRNTAFLQLQNLLMEGHPSDVNNNEKYGISHNMSIHDHQEIYTSVVLHTIKK